MSDHLIKQIAELFDKPYDFTKYMVELHAVTLPLPKFRHPDDGLNAFYSDMTSEYNLDPSLTKQEFTEECDPNNIIDRANRGLDVSMSFTKRQPVYGDFTDTPESFHEALNIVTRARQSFELLDADVRKRFDNDPAKFLAFVQDPQNADKLDDLGITEPKAQNTPPEASTVAPKAEQQPAGGGGEGA